MVYTSDRTDTSINFVLYLVNKDKVTYLIILNIFLVLVAFHVYLIHVKIRNIGECSVIIRMTGYKNYRKPSSDIMRAVGGKLYKPKYSNVKIHCSGAISQKGLIPLRLCIVHYRSFIPFIRQKFPYQHRYSILKNFAWNSQNQNPVIFDKSKFKWSKCFKIVPSFFSNKINF